MKNSLVRALLVFSVVAFVAIWTAAAQERGGGRRYGSSDNQSASSASDSTSVTRGEDRHSGRETADGDTTEETPEKIEADANGDYDFSFNWKWNGEREIECRIPAAAIVDSEKELEEIAESRDPYRTLGIDWTQYDENERNHVFWQALYRYLYVKNAARMASLTGKLREFKQKEGMTDQKFLEFVLSFVQNIRYKRPGGDLDILTQPDTLYRKFGDCDTKSLLLTTLLSGLGYDTVIFYSSFYSHAMAGIYMNGSGTSVKYNGKKYYFLETTYTGWKPGVLPPEYGNTRYWEVCALH
jgi:hypothetical protein